jgi:hypothetical protein
MLTLAVDATGVPKMVAPMLETPWLTAVKVAVKTPDP